MSSGLSAEDLDAAIAAGIIDRETLRRMHHVAAGRADAISADDEAFRLLTGFNDIFVTIGLALFLGALAWLFSQASIWLAAAAAAIAAWLLAMWFDVPDRERRTRRTDIAFWLHLAAAPAIVHSIVSGLIAPGSDLTSFDAVTIAALFIIVALVALVAERRALMVSALSYLIYAMGTLLTKAQWAVTGYAMATLTIGAIVLALPLGWRPLRALILRHMPAAVVQKVP